MFGLFRKKKDLKYQYRVTDLKKGFVFDYDMQTWLVEAEYEYDWGDGYFSKEFKVSSGTTNFFLCLDDDDELELSLMSKVSAPKLLGEFRAALQSKKKVMNNIEYKGGRFSLVEECPGYFRDISKGPAKDDSSWTELIMWDFKDKSGKNVLSIGQWGENSFEISLGSIIREFEISNIFPAPEE